MKQLFQRLFARKPSAQTEAAEDSRQAEATEARDNAAQALNAEAQAVVDRIRERTGATLTDASGTVVPLTSQDGVTKITPNEIIRSPKLSKRKPKGGDQ